jgi:hypothetical protein
MRHLLSLTLIFGLILGTAVQGAEELEITALSPVDLEYMEQQRELLQQLAKSKLGRSFSGIRANDLALLQTLLDNNLVVGQQTRELQAMGVILGDLLALDLNMHWVVYKDKLGRSRALRYGETEHYLFPVTMISRRRAVGNTDSIDAIYRKAYGIIDRARAPLPFQ